MVHDKTGEEEEEDYRNDLELWAEGDAETQAARDEAIAGFQTAVAEREAAQSLEQYQSDLRIQEAHEDAANARSALSGNHRTNQSVRVGCAIVGFLLNISGLLFWKISLHNFLKFDSFRGHRPVLC